MAIPINSADVVIRHTGLNPARHPQGNIAFHRARNDIARTQSADIRAAKLSAEDSLLLSNAAQAEARTYFTNKITALGLPATLIDDQLTPVTFVTSNRLGEKGVFSLMANQTLVQYDPSIYDSFDSAFFMTHAMSHQLGRREARLGWETLPMEHIVEESTAIGFEWFTGNRTNGQAIENGLALMDSVDFARERFQYIFPREYADRMNGGLTDIFQANRTLGTALMDLYGEVNESNGLAFIRIGKTKIPFTEWHRTHRMFDLTSWKNYRFAEELCRLVGYDDAGRAGVLHLTNQELINRGRALLDNDRYPHMVGGVNVKVRDGIGRIAAIFGSDVRTIIEARDLIGTTDIDVAMERVIDEQIARGMPR